MTASYNLGDSLPCGSPNQVGAAPLESILCTEELRQRPWRAPDYKVENTALVALCGALADAPDTILQKLANSVLEVLRADSAGLSLLTKDKKRFYWAAIAGAWQPHTGGGTPRDFGPCGDVLDRNVPLLFTHWERRYPYLSEATPLADEGLLVPFTVDGKAVGTIWVIAHTSRRRFDAEDLRLLESLGRFASAAYQAVASIDELKFQITERERAQAEVRKLAKGLQAKVRRLVDTNIMGIFIWNLKGEILEANDAFLRLVGYSQEDLDAGLLRWTDLTPAEWADADDRGASELASTGMAQPYEKEYIRKDGCRIPVLIGAANFEEGGDDGVAFVIDLTDRKKAEAAARENEQRYHEVEAELAHANRVSAMGQLSVSIAHEVNQPIAAVVTNANVALHWLGAKPADLEKVRQALGRVAKNGNRASDVIDRIRGFVKRVPVRKTNLDVNDAIRDVLTLTRAEAVKNGISMQAQLDKDLPIIEGDRVQLQQVILNLIINAIEALSNVDAGSRELLISTARYNSVGASVTVRDSGPGLDQANLERIFEAFYSTKDDGLGMGLSICRSIVEAHGGRLWATSNEQCGATFAFTLPAYPEGDID